MYGWLTFYHQGHEVAKDFKSFMTDLQIRLQRTRDNYHATQHEAQNLMLKMLEARKTVNVSLNFFVNSFVNNPFLTHYYVLFISCHFMHDFELVFTLYPATDLFLTHGWSEC